MVKSALVRKLATLAAYASGIQPLASRSPMVWVNSIRYASLGPMRALVMIGN